MARFTVTNEEDSTELGEGFRIGASGLRGQVERWEAGEAHRSFGAADEAIQQVLDRSGMTETARLRLDLSGPSREWEEEEATRALPEDDADTEIEVPPPPPGHGQVILSVDPDGIHSWHLPDEPPGDELVRGGAGHLRYRIPCQVTRSSGQGERTVLGIVNRALLKVLVFPVTDPVFGKLGEKFVARWERNKRPYGLRMFGPDNYRRPITSPLTEPDWQGLAAGRALLFVHGTFSISHNGFKDIAPLAMRDLSQAYGGRVFAFDHCTLSEDPDQNVAWFLEQVPEGIELEVDIICHSRGGLVSRTLAAAGDAGEAPIRVRRIVFVGTPNHGTLLARPGHMIDFVNRYTAIFSLLPSSILSEGLEVVVMLAKALAHGTLKKLPGLASMDPKGEFLERLNDPARPPLEAELYAVAADFKAEESNFKNVLKRVATNRALDRIFRGAPNDLVVPYTGVYEENGSPDFPIPPERRLRFETGVGIHHCSFFETDTTRKHLQEWLAPELSAAGAGEAALPESPRKVALLIGNSAYPDSSALRNPANDAEALSDRLAALDFEVIKAIDADRLAMHRAIRSYLDALPQAEMGIFFFAGHGIEYQGKNFMIPVDSGLLDEHEVVRDSVRLDLVMKDIDEVDCGLNILILDCCRKAPCRRLTRSGESGLTAVDVSGLRGSLLVAFATQPGHVALDGKGNNSPFTTALLRNLETPGIEAVDLIRRTGKAVRDETGGRQWPWYNSNLFDEVFIGGRPENVGAVPETLPVVPEEEPIAATEPEPVVELVEREPPAQSSWITRPQVVLDRYIRVMAERGDLTFVGQKLDLPHSAQDELVRRGYFDGEFIFWSEGRIQADVCLVGLLLDGREGEIRGLLHLIENEFAEEQCPLEALRAWSIEGDMEAAREKALVWLGSHADQALSQDLTYAVVCFLRHQLDLPEEATDLLRRVEANADDPFSRVSTAMAWRRILGEEEEARRCLETVLGQDPLADSLGSEMVLDDLERARELLEEAEGAALDNLSQLVTVASWWFFLGDEPRGMQVLGRAETLVTESEEWRFCAESWMLTTFDDARAQSCLKRWEKQAQDRKESQSLLLCGQAWLDFFNERGRARGCFETAQTLAESSTEMCVVADYWNTFLQDRKCALSALDLARDRARSATDWCACASSAIALDQEALARELVEQAFASEDESIGVLIEIAELAHQLDLVDLRDRALTDLEAAAEISSLWVSLAYTHGVTLEDREKAQSCLREAEKVAQDTADWLECANAWKWILEDREAGMACVKSAQELAQTKEQQQEVADTRELFEE